MATPPHDQTLPEYFLERARALLMTSSAVDKRRNKVTVRRWKSIANRIIEHVEEQLRAAGVDETTLTSRPLTAPSLQGSTVRRTGAKGIRDSDVFLPIRPPPHDLQDVSYSSVEAAPPRRVVFRDPATSQYHSNAMMQHVYTAACAALPEVTRGAKAELTPPSISVTHSEFELDVLPAVHLRGTWYLADEDGSTHWVAVANAEEHKRFQTALSTLAPPLREQFHLLPRILRRMKKSSAWKAPSSCTFDFMALYSVERGDFWMPDLVDNMRLLLTQLRAALLARKGGISPPFSPGENLLRSITVEVKRRIAEDIRTWLTLPLATRADIDAFFTQLMYEPVEPPLAAPAGCASRAASQHIEHAGMTTRAGIKRKRLSFD